MSLLLGQPPKLYLRKPLLVRASGGFSSSLLKTPPCFILATDPCGADLVKLRFAYTTRFTTHLEKKAPVELVYNDINDPVSYCEEDRVNDAMVTIGSSHGWVASLKNGMGILRLQDDLNPVALDSDPKRISLPRLVTLPHCQTKIITNVSLSSPSPEEEDCVVAVKFLGPQLSFCRPAAQGNSNSEWVNIRIENPCFFSSSVMFSKKDDMFRILGSGGHLIGSWDLHKHKHKLQKLQFRNLPELSNTIREVLSSCFTSEHLVESRSTGETFLVKQYKRTAEIVQGTARLKTEAVMVFKLDEQGNAVYTQDIGDLCLFLSKSEPFCVRASSFPGVHSNHVYIIDAKEMVIVNMTDSSTISIRVRVTPYFIPPQNIEY